MLIGLALFSQMMACGADARAERRVHLIVVADTNDPDIGKASGQDATMFLQMMLQISEDQTSGLVQEHELKGDQVSLEAIKRKIGEINADADDALVFYFSGHGLYHNRAERMLVGNKQEFRRSEVLRALESKASRLVVMITEACTSYTKTEPKLRNAECNAPRPASNGPDPVFMALFLDVDGVVDVNSSKLNLKSFVRAGKKPGSIFTHALASSISASSTSREATWDAILDETDVISNTEYTNRVSIAGYEPYVDENGISKNQEDHYSDRFQVLLRPSQSITPSDPNLPPPNMPTTAQSAPYFVSKLGLTTFERGGEVVVESMSSGSVATKAQEVGKQGWRFDNGEVILSANGNQVRTNQDLQRAVNSASDQIRVEVRCRENHVHLLVVKLRGTDPGNPNPPNGGSHYNGRLGIHVRQNGGDGVVVNTTDDNSAAMRLVNRATGEQNWHLDPGDIILSVNNQSVSSGATLDAALSSSNAQSTLSVRGTDGRIYEFNDNPGNNNNNNKPRFGAYVQEQNGEVVVTGRVSGSPAERCTMSDNSNWSMDVNEVIVSVNGEAVRSEEQWRNAVSRSPNLMTLQVRDTQGQVYTLTATLAY